MPIPKRMALFGGTFDPIHLGHIQVAKQAKSAFALDEVRFIPCQISPHKSDFPTAVEDRLEMLRLVTADTPWAVVDDIEAKQSGPSYSWKTAAALQQQFPHAKLYWIMGTDQWNALSQWAEPHHLASIVEFIVCTRGESPTAQPKFSCHTLVMQHPASSTQIRMDLARGLTDHPWLSNKVSQWIAQRELYRHT